VDGRESNRMRWAVEPAFTALAVGLAARRFPAVLDVRPSEKEG